MSEMKKDIKDLKEVVKFGIALEKFGKEVLAEGFKPEKLVGIFSLYPVAIAAFENIGDVVPEFKDLDEAEAAELVAVVVAEGVMSEHAAMMVTKAIKLALGAYELFKELKA